MGEEKEAEVGVEAAEAAESEQPVQYAVAEHDYVPDTPRALSFSAGDTLLLYCQASPDWWRGNKEGDDGLMLIPDSYIRLLGQDKPQSSLLRGSRGSSPANIRREMSEDEGVVSKLPSFKTKKQMWEQKTLDRKATKAPDLLKDVLNKSEEIEIVVPNNNKQDTVIVDTPV